MSSITCLKFVYPVSSPDAVFRSDPANQGFDADLILGLLSHARGRGHLVEIVGSDVLSEEDRVDLYWQTVAATKRSGARYGLRTIFGSRSRGGGPFFGSGVPALLVYEVGRMIGIYPHAEVEALVTIRAFLEQGVGESPDSHTQTEWVQG